MLSLRVCNYNTKRELFNYLLTVFPKNCLYAFSKQDLKLKRTDKTADAIKKGKFLYYNTKAKSELIFDIDNIRNTTLHNDLQWIARTFYEKFNLPINWILQTDNGIQFCISLNYPVKTKKQLKLLRDFKQLVIDNWELIDKAGSKRLKGWWRNPFTHNSIFYNTRVTFNELKEVLFKSLDVKKQFKTKIRKEQIKTNIHFTVGEPVIGNRNNFIWYNTMLNTASTNYNDIMQIVRQLNKKAEVPLDERELEKIAKNVLNYNKNNKNYIFANSKKANWNIGKMGFEKIRGLEFEDYKKEVKRRQQMAGKKIGKNNIIAYVKPKAEQTRNRVYEAIKELKNKKEKITVRKVKELAGVSLGSAQKYVKQAREEGII
jgi:hypothetical protein